MKLFWFHDNKFGDSYFVHAGDEEHAWEALFTETRIGRESSIDARAFDRDALKSRCDIFGQSKAADLATGVLLRVEDPHAEQIVLYKL